MAKRKLQRFEELKTMERMFQFPYPILQTGHGMKGNWHERVFGNSHPIVLELGCGRGEYTVNLSKKFPQKNFIGIDIKGARIWRGGKTINEENILNAAFLRIHIEWLGYFFEAGEVSEIWITFPDPQPQLTRENRRLTNRKFLELYRSVMKPGGLLHLKTDDCGLFEYSTGQLQIFPGDMLVLTRDLYQDPPEGFDLDIRTTYEQKFLAGGKAINYLCFRFP
jgi:tRNA (guanine-N7-)-methyltransferase